MTIAIAAIVTMIGIPSFRYVTNSNRIAGEVNGLLGDLQFARAEAIKEGQDVTVCASSTRHDLRRAPTTWQSGWIVYSNTANSTVPATNPYFASKARSPAPIPSCRRTVTTSAVTFNREGYAVGIANAGTLIIAA